MTVMESVDTSVLLATPVTETTQGLKQKDAEAESTNKRIKNNTVRTDTITQIKNDHCEYRKCVWVIIITVVEWYDNN